MPHHKQIFFNSSASSSFGKRIGGKVPLQRSVAWSRQPSRKHHSLGLPQGDTPWPFFSATAASLFFEKSSYFGQALIQCPSLPQRRQHFPACRSRRVGQSLAQCIAPHHQYGAGGSDPETDPTEEEVELLLASGRFGHCRLR